MPTPGFLDLQGLAPNTTYDAYFVILNRDGTYSNERPLMVTFSTGSNFSPASRLADPYNYAAKGNYLYTSTYTQIT
jgi:hypothetical protein